MSSPATSPRPRRTIDRETVRIPRRLVPLPPVERTIREGAENDDVLVESTPEDERATSTTPVVEKP